MPLTMAKRIEKLLGGREMMSAVAPCFPYTFDNVEREMTEEDAHDLAHILTLAGFEELGREIERAADRLSEPETFRFETGDLDPLRLVLRGRELRPGSGLAALRELLDQLASAQPPDDHDEGGEG